MSMASENKSATLDFLLELEAVIRSRAAAAPQESYTARLLGAGVQRVAQKFGEESVELALAAASGEPEAVRAEAADVIYHLLVLLEGRGVSLAAVVDELPWSRSPLGTRASCPRGGRDALVPSEAVALLFEV